MAWNREQNPTGISNPAVRPVAVDPLADGTSNEELRKVTRANARGPRPGSIRELPIAANARKADGFAPKATSEVL